ncbi:MAG TPA: restriction endonuclease subunit S [Syntrophorhabdaceae bacterium]|nr:restriction endonuclease subunit S [Syntrophorhabdaceae bacterium]HQM81065.1 restriction endonuclease subunit S [Syntrophorhabdaceae bacterium]
MSKNWPARKLREIADIRISNVDKKTYPNETPVKLCNYLDVYTNQYITDKIQFMEASATLTEIERFALRRGDVIITKDSETPDDIGIASVVSEDIEGLLCGYHLALIRPDENEMDPVYLAKQLSIPRVARYFSTHASGSTRYGLPISAIEAAEIPTPRKPEQAKIAEILSTVDRAIEQTEALIAKQQRIKAGLMQDLLTRGIDEHGNLRSEKTHKFKDSPLGRIPVEWEVRRLGSLLANINQGWSPDCGSDPSLIGEWGVLKTTAVVWQGYFENENKALPERLKPRSALEIAAGDLLMTRAGPNSRVGVIAYVYRTRDKLMLSDKIYRLLPSEEMDGRFLCYALSGFESQKYLSNLKTGMAESQTNISQEIVKRLLTVVPKKEEQAKIADLLDHNSHCSKQGVETLGELRSLKTALMQDLLTGKKRVSVLTSDMETPL